MRVTGQLTDGSRESRVTKCDPLSALNSCSPFTLNNWSLKQWLHVK